MTPHAGFKRSFFCFALVFALAHVGAQGLSAQTNEPGTFAPETVEPPAELAAGTDEPSTGGRLDVLLASLSIFVLAIFVGFEVITKVPPTLHTPLMSGSNAISGITLVGALLVAGTGKSGMASWLGLLAVVFATVNVVGGFWVTHRMLSMFKRR